MAGGKAMPGVRSKSLWAIWLILLLLLAAMPRPAAGAIGDCPLNEMAAPATVKAATVSELEEPLAAGAQATAITAEDLASATDSSKKKGQSHPAGTHGPRTPWPDMVPMDD